MALLKGEFGWNSGVQPSFREFIQAASDSFIGVGGGTSRIPSRVIFIAVPITNMRICTDLHLTTLSNLMLRLVRRARCKITNEEVSQRLNHYEDIVG